MTAMRLLSQRSSTRYGIKAHSDTHAGFIFPHDQWLNGLYPHDSTHRIAKSSRKRIQSNWFSSANYNN